MAVISECPKMLLSSGPPQTFVYMQGLVHYFHYIHRNLLIPLEDATL